MATNSQSLSAFIAMEKDLTSAFFDPRLEPSPGIRRRRRYTSPMTSTTKSFPFLTLPPEIRNQAYACFTVENEDRSREAYRNHSFIGMTQASQKLRVELRSLYWSCESVDISLRHLDNFRAAFRAPNTSGTSISRFIVNTTDLDVPTEQTGS
jgi:hypothetical protein